MTNQVLKLNTRFKLSPSSVDRAVVCPGSVAMLTAYPQYNPPSGAAALLGTAAHALAAYCVENDINPRTKIGAVIRVGFKDNGRDDALFVDEKPDRKKKDPRLFVVDDDMADAVSVYVEYIRNRVALLLGKTLTEAVASKELLVEQSGQASAYTSGTADCVIKCWPDTLEVVDYKHGEGVLVSVEETQQTLVYLLQAAETDDWDYQTFRHTIVQPRCRRSVEGGVASQDIEFEEFRKFPEKLLSVESRTKEAFDLIQGGAGLKDLFEAGFISQGESKGKSPCTFCPFKGSCPAQFEQAKAIASHLFTPIIGDGSAANKRVDIGGLSGEEIAEVLSAAGALRNWLKAVEAEAMTRALQKPDSIPGHKVIETIGRRAIRTDIDAGAAARQINKLTGVPTKDLVTKKLVGLTELGKLLKTALKDREDAKEVTESVYGICAKSGEPALKLVDSSHKAPEYAGPAPLAVFEAIDSED